MQRTAELALQHHQSGRLREAETMYRQVLASQPAYADVLNLLGVLLHQTGRNDEALRVIDRSIQINSRSAIYFNNQGLVLIAQKRLDEAEVAYRRAMMLHPDYADAIHSLAWILEQKGLFEEAAGAYDRVLRIQPDRLGAYNSLGNILSRLKRWEEATATYRRAIAVRPSYADAHINLGTALKEQGKLEDAIAAYKKAIAFEPNFPEAYNNLGNVLRSVGRTREALAAYHRAVELKPDYADAHHNLAICLYELHRIDESIAASEEAVRLKPDMAGAHNNLANVLKAAGRLDEAISAYRKAASLTQNSYAQANLMQAITFHPDYGPQQIYDEHVRWNDQFARALAPANADYPNDCSSERKLKIGYVSGYFRDHCQAFFIVPLLSHHDRERFEVYCYADVAHPDAVTDRIRGYTDGWRDVTGLNEEQIAELVRKDQIDILVDLTLHMDRNHMLAFARKPAPVQVTWLGYPGTTGLTAIDYRLSDPMLDPGFDDAFYSEKTVRLPSTFWCYDPLTSEPSVNDLPALSKGYVTFGCLNNLAKVTDKTIELWASVMLAAPNSRLVLLAPEGSARQRAIALLSKQGFPSDRIDFVHWLPRPQYLQEYLRIDICLDPFPCPGHTTSMDALWMGVPVVNLPGTTAIARGGVSILTNVGLPELIARSEEHYVSIASELAADLPRLNDLRRTLRQRLERSPLMDAPRFAKDVEAVYREMWDTWCKSHN
ncbi:MAG TPA: tetratricopeptide repeat protein [Tepidisphaeraceae bacterium]